MGSGARALMVDPNACREMQTFWDGCIEIDVSSADYVVATSLGSTIWVRGIESGDTSGGDVVILDHEDILGTGTPAQRTSQTITLVEGIIKCPFPNILKVISSGTTAASIRLYYQRKRA